QLLRRFGRLWPADGHRLLVAPPVRGGNPRRPVCISIPWQVGGLLVPVPRPAVLLAGQRHVRSRHQPAHSVLVSPEPDALAEHPPCWLAGWACPWRVVGSGVEPIWRRPLGSAMGHRFAADAALWRAHAWPAVPEVRGPDNGRDSGPDGFHAVCPHSSVLVRF